MRDIKEIIIHCSDSDNPHHNDINVIREWHLERGFNDVGYHYFIKHGGEIEEGRCEKVVGAHCKGRNRRSIGICLHGRDKSFTHLQYLSLAKLTQKLINKYNLKYADIHGHYEYSTKSCPDFRIDLWIEHYLN